MKQDQADRSKKEVIQPVDTSVNLAIIILTFLQESCATPKRIRIFCGIAVNNQYSWAVYRMSLNCLRKMCGLILKHRLLNNGIYKSTLPFFRFLETFFIAQQTKRTNEMMIGLLFFVFCFLETDKPRKLIGHFLTTGTIRPPLNSGKPDDYVYTVFSMLLCTHPWLPRRWLTASNI